MVFKAMRKDGIQKTRGDLCQSPEDSAKIKIYLGSSDLK